MEPGWRRHGRTLGVVLGLAVATTVLFAPALDHGFHYRDDGVYVHENPNVRDGLTWPGMRAAFEAGYVVNWHPVSWLSHMLDVELFGLDPRGHHGVSIALHALNAVLVFTLLTLWTGAAWRSAAVAALFALHPLRVESVVWLAERKDLLFSLFGLLALLSWTRFAWRGSRLAYACSLGCAALSLASKGMLVTLPFVLLLLDFWPLRRWPSRGWEDRAAVRGLLLEKLPFLLLSAGVSALTLVAQGPAIITRWTLAERVSNAIVAIPRYLEHTVWPVELAAMYPPEAWSGVAVAGAALLLSALTLGALWRWRDEPYLAVGWLFFIGTLAPVLGLIQVGPQSMADRYTYFPSIGLFIAIVWGFHRLAARAGPARAICGVALAAVLASCGLATRAQLHYWADDSALFARTIEVTGPNFLAQLTLGVIRMNQERLLESHEYLREAVRIDPSQARGHHALGYVLSRLGRKREGLARLEHAFAIRPDMAKLDEHLAWARRLVAELPPR